MYLFASNRLFRVLVRHIFRAGGSSRRPENARNSSMVDAKATRTALRRRRSARRSVRRLLWCLSVSNRRRSGHAGRLSTGTGTTVTNALFSPGAAANPMGTTLKPSRSARRLAGGEGDPNGGICFLPTIPERQKYNYVAYIPP
jgi:hypothetical protein